MADKFTLLEEIDDVLNFKFRNLNNFKEIADMLEVSSEFLHSILYKKRSYETFFIQKKSGGHREIKTPNNNLKLIQKKLAYILSLNYKMHKSAFGFIKNKSIIDNANLHINKRWVFNFDLEDFFHQFNQGRVIGLLRKYYKFNNTVAGILAEICCYENTLPQGAPTSPILSNILSFELDREFQKECRKYDCTYSRYVDDISISTNKFYFPKKLAYKNSQEETILGEISQTILDKTSFKVNQKKVYLRHETQHQNVTGLVVNEGVNVSRTYIKRIRATLHNLRVSNEEDGKNKFFLELSKHSSSRSQQFDMYAILKGKIQFVGQVKGKENQVFRKLATSFNQLDLPASVKPISILSSTEKKRCQNTYIVEVGYEIGEELFYYTGTAFYMKGVGIVSAAHTFKNYYDCKEYADSHHLYLINENKLTEKINITKKYIDYELDIAIFDIDTQLNTDDWGFEYSNSIIEGQSCVLLGYPRHIDGNTLNTEFGKITQKINQKCPNRFNKKTGTLGVEQTRFKISSDIYSGNSGGPILNDDDRVIAIAVKGYGDNAVEVNTVVPISDIFTYMLP
ncbi:reverse transcriptase domain-containing protein [Listeria immobilis]|uniref:reverse transcriptase domain-containing protein n=1 Tax=Listeria immobilis TaxID=2713502 RepID=UPI00162A1415|nr:reverse transcriptase domain-containing protein [Listeria immobilis]MBC1516942.1 trypsin-like serine protease [Listeria immobilis]